MTPTETFVCLAIMFIAFVIFGIIKEHKRTPEQTSKITNKDNDISAEELSNFDINEIKKLIEEEPKQEQTNQNNWSQSYQPRYLLTKNEWYAYRRLKEIADIRGFIICPKVRLLDIIEPRRGTNNYMSSLGKIQSKHVDFLICDKNLYIKAILELDDNSHNSVERQERDKFVNEVLRSVGYKVIHTKGIPDNILDEI